MSSFCQGNRLTFGPHYFLISKDLLLLLRSTRRTSLSPLQTHLRRLSKTWTTIRSNLGHKTSEKPFKRTIKIIYFTDKIQYYKLKFHLFPVQLTTTVQSVIKQFCIKIYYKKFYEIILFKTHVSNANSNVITMCFHTKLVVPEIVLFCHRLETVSEIWRNSILT